MENLTWQKVTKNLYTAVLIQAAAAVLGSIFEVINLLTAPASIAEALVTGEVGIGALDVLGFICSLAAIAGTVWFFILLGQWKQVADANDAPAIHKLWIASLLSMIGSVLALIPLIGIVGGIVSLVGLVFYILAVNALKVSTTLPENALKGANKLFVALILKIVGVCIAWIPVIGILGAICAIVGWVYELLAWKDIANS